MNPVRMLFAKHPRFPLPVPVGRYLYAGIRMPLPAARLLVRVAGHGLGQQLTGNGQQVRETGIRAVKMARRTTPESFPARGTEKNSGAVRRRE